MVLLSQEKVYIFGGCKDKFHHNYLFAMNLSK